MGGLRGSLWCGVICAELLRVGSWGCGPREGCLAGMVVVVAVVVAVVPGLRRGCHDKWQEQVVGKSMYRLSQRCCVGMM